MRPILICMIALCLGLALAPAGAAELTVYATGSMEVPLHQLGEEFTHATGHTLKFELGTTGVVMNKLKTGKADVIVISVEAADALQKDGRIVAGSRADVASSLFGVAVKKGAKAPDISTPEALKSVLLAAKSVVLACGGFQANAEWRTRYLGTGWDLAKVRGTRFNTGDGIRMALDVGAQAPGAEGGFGAGVAGRSVDERRHAPLRLVRSPQHPLQ